jgi:hypothetical protein
MTRWTDRFARRKASRKSVRSLLAVLVAAAALAPMLASIADARGRGRQIQKNDDRDRGTRDWGDQGRQFQKNDDRDRDSRDGGDQGRSSEDNGSGGERGGGGASFAPSGGGNDRSSSASDNSGASGRGKGDARDNGATKDAGPPRNLQEMFGRWLAPVPAPPQATPPHNAGHGGWGTHVWRDRGDGHKNKREVRRTLKDHEAKGLAAAAGSDDGKSQAKGAASAVARPRTTRLPAAVEQVERAGMLPDRLLAFNLDASAAARLSGLDFHVARTAPSILGEVTELRLPPGLDIVAARQLVNREFPQVSFTYSVRYRMSPQAEPAADGHTSPSALPDRSVGRPLGGAPCEHDRCYPRELVNWRMQLAGCSRRVKVGIVDTAVDTSHPALQQMRWQAGSFGQGGVANARNWHGTGVAALLAGSPSSPTPGLIPEAQFLIADIFSPGQDGLPEGDTFSLLRALDWLRALGVNVVNLSISGARDEAVEPALKALTARGVVFIAAAGNDGPDGAPSYPAAYPEVIAVTAVNKNLYSYARATRGSYVDIAAPGVDIWTALPDGRMGYRTGTSFAVPFVTSAVSAIYATTPAKTKAAILHRLKYKDLGPPGRDPIYGRGLVLAPEACQPSLPAVSSISKPGGIAAAAKE